MVSYSKMMHLTSVRNEKNRRECSGKWSYDKIKFFFVSVVTVVDDDDNVETLFAIHYNLHCLPKIDKTHRVRSTPQNILIPLICAMKECMRMG